MSNPSDPNLRASARRRKLLFGPTSDHDVESREHGRHDEGGADRDPDGTPTRRRDEAPDHRPDDPDYNRTDHDRPPHHLTRHRADQSTGRRRPPPGTLDRNDPDDGRSPSIHR